MKSIKLLTTLIMFAFSLSAQASNVDLAKSKVTWKGSKVIGSTHTGEVKIKSAQIKFKKGNPESGLIEVDMNSITDSDLTDPKWNKKLIGHLKSEDFFNVDKYKTAKFDIKKIQKASDKFYFVSGDLTIRGVTKSIKLKAEVKSDNKASQIIVANLKFDRTHYGIKYGSGSFFADLGDKMISDEVELDIELHINKENVVASR